MNTRDTSYDPEERLLDCAANIILLCDETDHLIRISVTSVNTARKRL